MWSCYRRPKTRTVNMTLKNMKQMKDALVFGHCVNCLSGDLSILNESTIDEVDLLFCMKCCHTDNKYATKLFARKGEELDVVEINFNKKGFTLQPKKVYGIKKSGVFYQVETIGGPLNPEENNG